MSFDAVGDEEADSAENGRVRVRVRVRRHRIAVLVIPAYETAGAAGTMAQDFIGAKRDTIATKAH